MRKIITGILALVICGTWVELASSSAPSPELRVDRLARLQVKSRLAPVAKRATPHRLRNW